MLSLVILGTGNIANHLFDAFEKLDHVVVAQVVGRSAQKLQKFAQHTSTTTDFDNVLDADIYLIAVKDDAIGEVSAHLADKKGLVVHTSGVVDMHAISNFNRGAFYPLQTFSKERPMDFSQIPICVEAQDHHSLGKLKKLASLLSDSVHEINSEQRKKLHLAAVFVNNFTNYLYGIGEEICLSEGLAFDLLKPLILETAEKVQDLSPKAAQTGPAKRGDIASMQAHLKLIEREELKKLYKHLSEAIQKAYEKEL
ncbi:Rossmann-like and DUF2520 domain-containing protein [Flagellimonas meishanensis]|uniref:Rossmann-like and DUF2520 domain-containing protein n=1 Tax=Flagellimonas meishanensis TaxID=2873264 RepID=UPI001CA77CEC|nr:Rossmann-like and DUF2520 domain-containing protein [[Muricauda] meishanensis]